MAKEVPIHSFNNPNFLFGFNVPRFSDRILTLVIDEGSSDTSSSILNPRLKSSSTDEGCCLTGQDKGEKKKRKLQDESATAVFGESPGATATKATRISVSSLLLAEQSSFFCGLFSNGLKESAQEEVTLHLNHGEEATMLQLLRFIYARSIDPEDSKSELLRLLLLADRFAVVSCVHMCAITLREAAMLDEEASTYIEMLANLQHHESVRLLVDCARNHLEAKYADLSRWRTLDGLLELPVPVLEVVLANKQMRVKSEKDLFDIALDYVRRVHPEDLDQRSTLLSQLGCHIRFPLMATEELRDAAVVPEMTTEGPRALLMEALWFKASPSTEQLRLEADAAHMRYTRRKSSLQEPWSIFFDVEYDKVRRLTAGMVVDFNPSCVQGVWFYLKIHRYAGNPDTVGMYLLLSQSEAHNNQLGPDGIRVEYVLLVRLWPSGKFKQLKYKFCTKFNVGQHGWGHNDFFNLPWPEVVKEDGPHFHNGIMYIRADINIFDNSHVVDVE